MKAFVLIVILAMASGCATVVTDDYQKYLNNNQGQSYPVLGYDAQYIVTPSTKNHRMEISSGMAGIGNTWEVQFGPLLDATLQSPDIQKAFKSFSQAGGSGQTGRVITFHLVSYDFSNHRAKIQMTITAAMNGKTTLEKTYSAEGNSQGGKMFWGGAWAMKNAVQQSTKFAMDSILRNFFSDLKASK